MSAPRATRRRTAASPSATATPAPVPARTATPPRPAPATVPDAPPHGPRLDRYDLAILDALQRDARLSNAELAARVGLTAAPTWRRVKGLEQAGYITGYRAVIDRRRIGLGVLALVRIDAERHVAEAAAALERAIQALPEVIAGHYVSGAGTFELQAVFTDLDAYARWVRDVVFKLPNVKDVHTSFAIGDVEVAGTLPLAHLRR